MASTATPTKVPAVTLGFWVIKIAATTLGETGGDTVTMTMDLGYLTGTAIFRSVLVLLVALQVAARKFPPFIYWATIVASTTAGTMPPRRSISWSPWSPTSSSTGGSFGGSRASWSSLCG